jgi:hypothetical protein
MRARETLRRLGRFIALITMLPTACTTYGPLFQQAPPPPSGKALVYIYRVDTFPPSYEPALFNINNADIAELLPNTYTWIYLREGQYRLQQMFDNPRVGHIPTQQDFYAHAGLAYYFRLNVYTGVRQTAWRLVNATALGPGEEISKCTYQASKNADAF